MYMMRYLKSFNESVDSFSDDLQDFCNQYLAYLLDEGFTVTLDNKFQDFYTIRLSLGRVNYNWVEADSEFLWDSVKDHYVPFLQMLARTYDLKQFAGGREVFFITGDHRHQNNLSYYDDVVSGVEDQKLGEMVLGGIIVMVGTTKRSLTSAYRDSGIVESSSVNLQDELEYQAEVFLAPLEEEGFSYEVRPVWDNYGSEFCIRLSFTDNGSSGTAVPINKLFNYSDVMDRFIPLVRMLSRNYDLLDQVYFYSTQESDINKKIFSVEQISDGVKPDYMVTEVKLTVKGKLQKVVESRKSTTDELKEFSEDCLVYLLDDGFEITTYTMAHNDKSAVIWIDKPGTPVGWNMKKTRIGFEWDEVKDYVIPFVQMLAKKYRLDKFDTVGSVQYPVRFNYGSDSPDLEDFTYDQIVNDNLFNDADNEFKHKYTKRGFTSWEKIYTIGIRVIV